MVRLRGVALITIVLGAIPTSGNALPLVPGNDRFQRATVVASLPFAEDAALLLARSQLREPLCGGSGHTVWYDFTPPTGMDFGITATGASARIGVFTGGSLGSLKQVACGGWGETFVHANAGRTYHVQLDGELPADSSLTLRIRGVGRISGRVTDASGAGLSGICVAPTSTDDSFDSYLPSVQTRSDGTYVIHDLEPSHYDLRFECTSDYAPEWYDDAVFRRDAQHIEVTPGSETIADAALMRGTSISGTVVSASGEPVSTCVEAFGAPDDVAGVSQSASDGSYVIQLHDAGSYRVFFGCGRYVDGTWFSGKGGYDQADPVVVEPGSNTSGIDGVATPVPAPTNYSVDRAADISALPYTDTENLNRVPPWLENPQPCDGSSSPRRPALWYRYVSDTDRVVVMDASLPYVTLDAWEGSDPSSLTRVACTQRKYGVRELAFTARAGQTYFIEVSEEMYYMWDGPAVTLHMDETLGSTSTVFAPGIPCAAACPYWNLTTDGHEAACQPQPLAPPGSWQDVVVTVPDAVEGAMPTSLAFRIRPSIDEDSFVCRGSPDEDGRYFVATGAAPNAGVCDPTLGEACEEVTAIAVAPGETYVLRVYNWADTAASAADWSWRVSR